MNTLESRETGKRNPKYLNPNHDHDRLQENFSSWKVLKQHFGCVNALAITPNSTLLSSGDDLRLLVYSPSLLYPDSDLLLSDSTAHLKADIQTGHMSNVFAIATDSTSKIAHSVGNDGFLISYDLETEKRTNITLAHEDACLRLSIKPTNDSVILTASQDYTIKMWDTRTRAPIGSFRPSGRVMQNFVQFNPTNPDQFVTSDSKSGVYLWDLRMAFKQTSPVPLVRYATRSVKENPQRPSSLLISGLIDITSASFSPCGSYICTTTQKSFPTLYNTTSEDPILVLHDPQYSALATIKTGTFTHHNSSLFYVAGSDNGQCFGWNISNPPPSQNTHTFQSTEGFSTPPLIPSSFTLKGGNTIINSVVAHPSFLVTAGVEKSVRIFTTLREMPACIDIPPVPEAIESEATLALFDRLIAQERRGLEAAVWRRMGNDSDSDELDEEVDSDREQSDVDYESD